MIRIFLTTILVSFVLILKAQIQEGYFPFGSSQYPFPYAADFVSDPSMTVENVYWWNQRSLKDPLSDSIVRVKSDSFAFAINKCIHSVKRFQYSSVREQGKIVYTMDAPYGTYEPIGVGFGNGNTLDISQGNAFVGFKMKNTSSVNLVLKVGIQDEKKFVINSLPLSAATSPHNFYKEEIYIFIPAGSIIDTVIDFNPCKYPAHPYYANYSKDSCSRAEIPTKEMNFDYSKLSAVTFTLVTARQNSSDGYKSYSFKGTFEIYKFLVGYKNGGISCPVNPLGFKNVDSIVPGSFSGYPNPLSGSILHLNMEADNIKITDVLGNVVLSISSAEEVNVSALNKGVYTLHSSKGTIRFVIQ